MSPNANGSPTATRAAVGSAPASLAVSETDPAATRSAEARHVVAQEEQSRAGTARESVLCVPAMRSLPLPSLLSLLLACSPSSQTAEVPSAAATQSASAAPPPPASATAAPAGLAEVSPEIQAVIASPDRTPEDRALDEGRSPGELLTFFGVKSGMAVAEIGAGGGYTAELLARAVGPTGKVYGQNPKFVLEKFAEKPWSERLKKPVMKNVVRVDREFSEPLPPDAKDLDVVFLVLFYHDLFWMKADRKKMNETIFAALKPGGVYAIVDHAARAGAGDADVQTLHRIEERTVREEVERAGFRLDKEGTFLRNPKDTRDWNASPSSAGEKRGTSDRFVLLFRKP